MTAAEFKQRRRRLMRQMGKGSVAIIPAAQHALRNRDVEYPFRQDSDFYYLTGFNEPNAVAVLCPKRSKGEYLMFCAERDPDLEIWVGPRAGVEGVKIDYAADDAFPLAKIDQILPKLLEGCDKVYYAMGYHPGFDQRVIDWVNQIRANARSGSRAPGEIVVLDHLLHELRLFKSRREVQSMRQAAKISEQAHKRAMRLCRPGLNEYEVEAEILQHFRQNNCDTAYSSIVGGGKNSCVLHYVNNDEPLKDGDLLLIDAGAEKELYASDITRTFPINGKFSPAQKAIYNIVLAAQLAAIKCIKPGNHWNQPHEAAVKVITKGLVEQGLLKGNVAKLIKNEDYKRFFMHRTGHWLGMDVHDVGTYKLNDRWRKFEPGMTLTVEPGIYIPAGTKSVAKKWWNIGVRIEDDVLVTKQGNEVLSAGLPKSVGDIEALMAG
jgi:Xaa-Pro aminopeptidase